MKILIGCEESGVVRDAFKKKGHDAWSCDLLPTRKPGNHLICDVINAITDPELINNSFLALTTLLRH